MTTKEEDAKKAAKKAKFEARIDELMHKTGWSREEAIEKYKDAKARTGCRLDEYLNYRFWELDEETQNNWVVVKFSKKATKTFNTDRDFINLLMNKAKTNEYLKDYIGRGYCINRDITREEFKEIFKDCDKVFYKPMKSHWGLGAQAFVVNDETIDSVYDETMALPEGVVEEFVVQHDEMNRLSPTAVNTVRIVTISSKDKPVKKDGKKADIVYAMIKMGGATGCVDNLHGGGLGAAVDLETGEIITPAISDFVVPHIYHPVTGTKIPGFKIPLFQEVKELAMRTIDELGLEGYLGWDIAVTNKGPVIIEINATPGVTLLQLPYVPEKKGMKHVFDDYLIGDPSFEKGEEE